LLRVGAARSVGPGALRSSGGSGGPPVWPAGILVMASTANTNSGVGRCAGAAPAAGAGGGVAGAAGAGAAAYTITWCSTFGSPARTSIAWIHLSSVVLVGIV